MNKDIARRKIDTRAIVLHLRRKATATTFDQVTLHYLEDSVKRVVVLLVALAGPAQAADHALPLVEQTPARGTATEPEQPEKLPPGVIQRGTLANPKLLADSALGVSAVAGTLGIKPIEKALPYVTELPQGPPGSRAWTERWVVSNGGVSAAIGIRFLEDGAGGATWSIEVPQPASEQKQYVAAAQEFVRHAKAGNVDRMIAITSEKTVRNSDLRQLTESYRKYVVPRFKGATVTWADSHALATDETGNRGWDVAGRAEGAESFSFFITVMKEDNKYVIVTLGRREQDNASP